MKVTNGKISTAAASNANAITPLEFATAQRTSLLKAKAAGNDGTLVIVRPSQLDKDKVTGIVASGVLEKVEPNKFNAAKNDYFIRNKKTNTLYILNETQSIKEQLGQDGTIGLNIEVEYKGKIKTKSGTGFHQFECFIVNK